MLKKFFLIAFIFLLSISSFSENKINFMFNTDKGYIEYTNLETKEVSVLNFSSRDVSLDIENGIYNFQFFSPDFNSKEIVIDSDNISKFYNIDLEKKNATFFISILESRRQEVYFSEKPVHPGKELNGGELIFYLDGISVKTKKIKNILEPIELDYGNYDIDLVSRGKTIFKTKNLQVNESNGNFINFFASGTQINVKGTINTDDMLIGGAKIIFTDVDNNSYIMESDFSGEFSGYLPARKYSLKVEKFGYSLKNDARLLYDFTSNSTSQELTLELEEIPSVIRGRVFDDQSTPLNDALVTIKFEDERFETYTDNYGRFDGVTSAGLVFIKVEKEGYFHHGLVQKVEKSSTVSNLEIKINRKLFSLKGIISDGVSPIKRKRLDLIDENGKRFDSTLSGDNGFYEFLDIPATKTFYIKVSTPGYSVFNSKKFKLEENDESFNIILEPDGSIVILQLLNKASKPLKETKVLINGVEDKTDDNGLIYVVIDDAVVDITVGGITHSLRLKNKQEIHELIF